MQLRLPNLGLKQMASREIVHVYKAQSRAAGITNSVKMIDILHMTGQLSETIHAALLHHVTLVTRSAPHPE